ncbi:MAG: type IX secretion system sortase PorU [Cyclobacteriaceae bacterium]
MLLLTCSYAFASSDTLGIYHIKWNTSPDTLPQPSGSTVIVHQIENGIFHQGQPYQRLILPGSIKKAHIYQPFYGPLPYDIDKVTLKKTRVQQNIKLNSGRDNNIVDVPVLKYDDVLQDWLVLQQYKLIIEEGNDQQNVAARKTNETGSSVLAEGQWIKLAILQEGIYRLDYKYLKSIGLPVDQINPQNLRLYGNGGKMLPQPNHIARPADLQENAIVVAGEQDGVFNTDDYLLFYGQNSDFLSFDTLAQDWSWQNNDYSDTTFYFLIAGDSPGLRISSLNNTTGQSEATFNYYDDAYVHELDKYNLLEEDLVTNSGSGRNWLGEKFNSINPNATIDLPLNNLVTTFPATIRLKMVSNSLQPSTFNVSLNSTTVGTLNIPAIPEGRYSIKGVQEEASFVVDNPAAGPLQVKINFTNPGSSSSIAYLDHLLVSCRRKLSYDNFFKFRVLESVEHQFSRFNISTTQPVTIWNITNPIIPAQVKLEDEDAGVSFVAPTRKLEEFLVFSSNDFLQPVSSRPLDNQNLRADLSPQMVIIAHPLFLQAANQLANFRGAHDQMNVKVVTPGQVYNEFAGGSPDVTAFRDYMKYLYDNGNIQYLLLFGKCSFDFKNILSNGNLNASPNFVPTYQSRNSFHPIFSYSSDDYFGFLDDNEGEWAESSGGDHLMEIGVGRLPATTSEEAEIMVQKIIAYDTEKSIFGNWRKKIYFVADDEDFNTHQKDADILAEFLSENFTDLDINKIYLDAFPQQTTSFGERAPGVNQAIREAVDQGGLIVNFTGHGSEIQWTDEKVLDNIVIEELDNQGKLPLFVTATCEFGRHDNPLIRSGAEQLLTNKRGGAIGLVTTARPVYSNTNFQLNRAFYQSAFQPVNGQMPRLGDIFKYTKNNSLSGSINRNFSLLGDPSMRLAYPENQVIVEKIISNGNAADTLKALDKIEIRGVVTNSAGDQLPGFSGEILATVFDKPRTITTLGNKSPQMTFLQRDNLLFQGKASVKNGHFSLTFPVPKNINYQFGEGKISLYAYNQNEEVDATGFVNQTIGGSVVQPVVDNTPPTIELFLNDTLFNNGDVTGPNPILLARISDESGINISSSGLGQDINAQLNQDKIYLLNKFFTAQLDDYTSGWVEYKFNNLPEGEHILEMKAWDIYNNAANAKIEFWVGELKKLILSELKNYPNPFQQKTNVTVGHNKAGLTLQVNLKVYNSKGSVVLDNSFSYDQATSRINLEWEGNDARGNKLPAGIYIMRMMVRCVEDGSSNVATTKLLIVN